MTPNGTEAQTFAVRVPKGGTYLLMAALDAGDPSVTTAPSGSGGVGTAERGAIEANVDVGGLLVALGAAPMRPMRAP